MVIDLLKVGTETTFLNFPKMWEVVVEESGISLNNGLNREENTEKGLTYLKDNFSWVLEQVLPGKVIITDNSGIDVVSLQELHGNNCFFILESQVREILNEFEKYLKE